VNLFLLLPLFIERIRQKFLSYAELEEQGELDRQRAERLAAKLRELNIDPDSI